MAQQSRTSRLAVAVLALSAVLGAGRAHAGLLDKPADSSQLCGAAVQAAEARYTLPTGLLYAISEVESGRPVDGGSTRRPWPWTVQAESQSHYFATEAAAIQWVQQAQARGVASIDVGCMQVNLMYHPSAFRTLDDAFDPAHNADYAARFLTSLHAETGDWHEAAGRYHSETLALAMPYRRQVEAVLHGGGFALSPQAIRLQKMQAAWNATLAPGKPAETALSGDWSKLLAKPGADRHLHRRPRRVILLTDAN
ncbi:MAG TPA: transglycosylase SLT domain-containing protein [Acidisoma sp.]|jgi:soluble lytic murein transglycosylase-like protein|uniref:transglycosylase SLT domain-containing protein n=1 Tax=Acidisoma sp. TaxID=1872115 RepID=UPI002C8CC227|nr:transglycosylase SLT domain-containing protein [Acidisoma sp.]HTH99764.1 transglycosylase SLT domain-containing protein [Acidisoma sp.]